MPEVLTAEQVAEWLGVTVSHVQRLAKRGEIPARKVGYLWRFSKPALEEWMKGGVSSRTEEEHQ